MYGCMCTCMYQCTYEYGRVCACRDVWEYVRMDVLMYVYGYTIICTKV